MENKEFQILNQAVNLHKENKLVLAAKNYQAVLKINPNQPDALHNLGLILQGTEKRELSKKLFEKAVNVLPSEPQYWVSLIKYHIKYDNFNDLEDIVHRAQSEKVGGNKLIAVLNEAQIKLSYHHEGSIPDENKLAKINQEIDARLFLSAL